MNAGGGVVLLARVAALHQLLQEELVQQWPQPPCHHQEQRQLEQHIE